MTTNPQETASELVPAATAVGALTVAPKTPAQRAAIAMFSSKREIELTALAAKSSDIKEVLNADGRAQAHRMAMDLKNARCDITNEAEDVRDDSTKFSKAVIEVSRALVAIIQPEETRVFKLRDDFDAKLATEKAEAERIEAAKVAAIRVKISDITSLPAKNAGSTSTEIYIVLAGLAMREIMDDEFGALTGEARAAVELAANELQALYTAAKGREQAEVDRLAEVAAEQARIAEEKETNRIESERLAALQREAEDKETERVRLAVIEQARLDELTAAAMLKQQAAEAAARAESSRLAAERAALDAEKAAFAAQQAAAAAPLPIEHEAVQAAIEAEDAAPDPVAQLLVLPVELAHDIAPMVQKKLIDVLPPAHMAAGLNLRVAVQELLGYGYRGDAIRALVESELKA